MKPDNELKQLLAKLLPDQLKWMVVNSIGFLMWNSGVPVKDTELPYICGLIEQTLERKRYSDVLKSVIMDDPCWDLGAVEARYETARASWQQRTMALAQVKGLL